MAGKGGCDIAYDAANNWIFADWYGRPDPDDMMAFGAKMKDLMLQKRCYKFLNSNQRIEGSWAMSSSYVAEVWFPDMVKNGLKYFAWVLSKDALSRLQINEAISKNDNEILHSFGDIDEAKKWLKSVV